MSSEPRKSPTGARGLLRPPLPPGYQYRALRFCLRFTNLTFALPVFPAQHGSIWHKNMSTVDLTASDPFSRYQIIDPEGAETPSPNMAVMCFEAPVKATQTDRIETGNNGIRVVGEAKKKKSLPPPPRRLLKHQSWSSESCREEAWIRKKDQQSKLRKSKSLTDDDVDELRGCIDLGFGFGFDSEGEGDHKLCDTLPALYFYYAVNKHYNGSKLKSSPLASPPSSSSSSCDENSPEGHDLDTWIISSPGDNPQLVKTRLRHWAQVVACSVRQCC